ncbi:MAG TPA: hypothetical protein VGB19_09755 [Actinomycetota bacterium]
MLARFRTVVLGAAVVAAVVGPAVPAQASTRIKGTCTGVPVVYAWSPKAPSVAKGTKVIWKAVSCSHTVTSYSSNWSKNVTLQVGQTTSRVFNTKGVYRFRCKFHSTLTSGKCSGMCGRVTVG